MLERVGDGDEATFAELYQLTSARLFGACVRILGDGREAQEALQDAYLSIWRRAATFDRARGSPMAWIMTVCRNCAIDKRRAQRSMAAVPISFAEDVADSAPLAQEVAIDRQEQSRLFDCLSRLESLDLNLIQTAFFEGFTYAELSDRMAKPLSTVKSRIRRALLKLRDCLQ